MIHLLNSLAFLMPTCVTFGPFFSALGVSNMNANQTRMKPALAIAFLFAGAAMTSFALLSLYLKVYAPGAV